MSKPDWDITSANSGAKHGRRRHPVVRPRTARSPPTRSCSSTASWPGACVTAVGDELEATQRFHEIGRLQPFDALKEGQPFGRAVEPELPAYAGHLLHRDRKWLRDGRR